MSKLRVLPDCPKCEEPDLRYSRAGHEIWLHCYCCGWKSGIITIDVMPSQADDVIDAAIAEAVAAAANGVAQAASGVEVAGEG